MKVIVKDKTTPEERETIREFANRITPPNWHVFFGTDFPKRRKRNYVYLRLEVVDKGEESQYAGEYNALCRMHGFKNGAMLAEIFINSGLWNLWQSSLIHELAHAAVHRYIGYRLKTHLHPEEDFWLYGYQHSLTPALKRDVSHGRRFKCAKRTLTHRAKRLV